MAAHALKCWPEFFQPIFEGKKTHEIRINDRGYKVGDLLLLGEWNPETEEYTGRNLTVEVTYISETSTIAYRDVSRQGMMLLKSLLHPQAVVMSIARSVFTSGVEGEGPVVFVRSHERGAGAQ